MISNFHFGSGQTVNQQIANGSMIASKNILNHALTNVWSPRAGVAWDVDGQGTYVLRAGFGVCHQWPTLGNEDNGLVDNPPGYVFPTFFSNGSTAVAPIFSKGTTNKPPFGFVYPTIGSTQLDSHGELAGYQISVGGVDPNLKLPKTYTYSGTLERKLFSNFIGSVGYTGSHSDNLITGSGQVTATSYGVDINRFANGLVLNNGKTTGLNPSFGTVRYAQNGATANYNAFIFGVRGRFVRGATVNASYTRSAS